jgi:branched-chain amino acid transport system substrate-binding protein
MPRQLTLGRRPFLITAGASALALSLAPRTRAAAPYRIGALNPVTGAGSPYGSGMQTAILLAADEVNQAGGAAGRTLEVIAEDTQTSPESAVLAAKKLIEVNRVDAILGTWSSGVSLAVMPLTDAADVILMNTSGAPSISTEDQRDLVWRFQATNDRFGAAFAEIAKREGVERPATMAFNNASGRGNADGFKKAWEAMGNEVVAAVVYEPDQPSYRSEVQQILAADPDLIVMGSYLPDTTIILREWYQMGGTNGWIIPGWAANPQLVENVGAELLDGVFSVDMVPNIEGEAFARLNESYQAKAGQPAGDNVYATMAYDMVISLALAIQHAGTDAGNLEIVQSIRSVANPEGTAVTGFAEGKKLLEQGEEINYEGASSRLDFDEYGDVTPDFGVSTLEDGKWVRQFVVEI